MTWKSVFDTGPCTLSVSTGAGGIAGVLTNTPLWTGVLGKEQAITFADQAGWNNTQLTLAVDVNGKITLVGDLGDPTSSGRKYYVQVTPSVALSHLRFGAFDLQFLANNDGVVDQTIVIALGTVTAPYEFPSPPTTSFGMVAGPNGS